VVEQGTLRLPAIIDLIHRLQEPPVMVPLTDVDAYPQPTLRPEADRERHEAPLVGEVATSMPRSTNRPPRG